MVCGFACGAFLLFLCDPFFQQVKNHVSAFFGIDDFGGWGEEA